jgi:hypothetical protein
MILAADSCRAFIAGGQMPEAVSWSSGFVSRETAPWRALNALVSRETGSRQNKEILFSDAEIAKNHVQDILDIDPSGETSQCPASQSQFLGNDIFAAF